MPAGKPERVNVHDFVDKELGKATPYGVSDVTANTGWVNVGTDADTGAFAVESIRRWVGHRRADRLPGPGFLGVVDRHHFNTLLGTMPITSARMMAH